MVDYDINRPWLSLDDWQKEYVFAKEDTDNFLLTGRQSGKTTAMSLRAVELCMHHFKKGEFVLINSLTERQARILLNRAKIYAEAKYKSKIDMTKDNKPTLNRIMFRNGTGVLCYAAGEKGDSSRGDTIKKLMVDEGARMSEEYFEAAMPTLSVTQGSMDIASTPYGKHHKDGTPKFFYKCSMNPKFKKYYISAEDCPRHTKEFLEEMKQRYSRLSYAQEFLAQFTDELRRVFDEELIIRICTGKRRDGNFGFPFFLGVDVAGFGNDLTTYEVFEQRDEKTYHVDNIIERRNYTTETSRRIIQLQHKYDFSGIGVDDGGVGFGVFSELMDNDDTKRVTEALNNASRPTTYEEDGRGRRLLKEEMYMKLLAMMENNKIVLLDDSDVKASLSSMQYDEDGKIFGSDSHISEGIVRGVWMATKGKSLNFRVFSIRV